MYNMYGTERSCYMISNKGEGINCDHSVILRRNKSKSKLKKKRLKNMDIYPNFYKDVIYFG